MDITTNGFRFTLNVYNEAWITEYKDTKYNGIVKIPDTFYDNARNKEYKVVGISSYAFFESKATGFIVPKTIKYIDSTAFNYTDYYRNAKNWSKDGGLYIGDCLIAVSPGCDENFVLPQGVRVVAESAFATAAIKTFRASKSLEYISTNAFFNCPLSEITLYSNIKHISNMQQIDIDDPSKMQIINFNNNKEVERWANVHGYNVVHSGSKLHQFLSQELMQETQEKM